MSKGLGIVELAVLACIKQCGQRSEREDAYYKAGGCCGGPIVTPATTMVDYVHVYQQGGTPITPQPNYGGPGANGP